MYLFASAGNMEGGGGRVDSPKGGAAGSSAGPVIDKTLDPLVKKWMDEKTTETKEKVHTALIIQYFDELFHRLAPEAVRQVPPQGA